MSVSQVYKTTPPVCLACRCRVQQIRVRRAFSSAPSRAAQDENIQSRPQRARPSPPSVTETGANPQRNDVQDLLTAMVDKPGVGAKGTVPSRTPSLSEILSRSGTISPPARPSRSSIIRSNPNKPSLADIFGPDADESVSQESVVIRPPHRLNVYAHKRNTHLTLVQAPRLAMDTVSSEINHTTTSVAERKKMVDVLLSKSTGDLGFRKAGRGTYDAAFQLGAYFLAQMKERGMVRDLAQLDVVLRGFGPGREAIQKLLLGTEGKFIKERIVSVSDATRLKFGGCRSRKRRRI